MKKFIILLFFSISINCFANDLVIPKGAPCPEGGYHPGKGSPYVCCKDGFYFESYTKKYDGIQAHVCGCPDGGTPSRTCAVECCKDGYAFGANIPGYPNGSGKYDVIKPACCCPDGGTRSETGICCKDGYAFNEETNKYDSVNGNCGCPDGGIQSTRSLRGEKFCCKDGFMYDNESLAYSRIWPDFCGCPENGILVSTGRSDFMDGECCQAGKTGYRWSYDSYSDFYPEYCGCPDGGELKGGQKNKYGVWEVPYCCKNSFMYDKYKAKSYSKVDIRCGCPKGHEKECETQKEILENPEKALKELKNFMAHMQPQEEKK